jgi:hypothetical protein
MKSLREAVSEMMVHAHEIPLELARYHVSGMDCVEVRQRFRMYIKRGAELSAVGPKLEGSTCLPPSFHAPNDDGRPAAFNPVSAWLPEFRPNPGQAMPDSGKNNWVQDRRQV